MSFSDNVKYCSSHLPLQSAASNTGAHDNGVSMFSGMNGTIMCFLWGEGPWDSVVPSILPALRPTHTSANHRTVCIPEQLVRQTDRQTDSNQPDRPKTTKKLGRWIHSCLFGCLITSNLYKFVLMGLSCLRLCRSCRSGASGPASTRIRWNHNRTKKHSHTHTALHYNICWLSWRHKVNLSHTHTHTPDRDISPHKQPTPLTAYKQHRFTTLPATIALSFTQPQSTAASSSPSLSGIAPASWKDDLTCLPIDWNFCFHHCAVQSGGDTLGWTERADQTCSPDERDERTARWRVTVKVNTPRSRI